MSPIQPTWLPPNCEFEVSDCTEEWTFKPETFDFIHVRGLYGSVANWDAFYQEVYKYGVPPKCGFSRLNLFRTLKPGAYVQQVEQSVVPKSDDRTTDGTIFEKFGRISLETGDTFGKTLRVVDESADYMRKVGLEEVTETRFKIPIGPWAKDKKMKELGQYNRLQWEEGLEGWVVYLLTTIKGVSCRPHCQSLFTEAPAMLTTVLDSGLEKKSNYTSSRCEKVWRIETSTLIRNSESDLYR